MIESFIDFLRSLTNPERLIALLSTVLSGWLGYVALIAIVFAETGLLIGFFLPGDSLLFTVGVVAGAGQLNIALINVAPRFAGEDYHSGYRHGLAGWGAPSSIVQCGSDRPAVTSA